MSFISASQAQTQTLSADSTLLALEQARLGEKYKSIFDQISAVAAAGESQFTVRWNKSVWYELHSVLEDSGYIVEEPPTPAEDGVAYSDTHRIYNLTINWTPAPANNTLTGLNRTSFTTTRSEPFSVSFAPQGGVAPYTITVITESATIPTGLVWSDLTEITTFTLSGTPTQISQGTFILRVRDWSNQTIDVSVDWSITSLGTVIPTINEDTDGQFLSNDGAVYLWADQVAQAITVTPSGSINAGPSSSATGGGISLGYQTSSTNWGVSIGYQTNSAENAIGLGHLAANSSQSARAIAIGPYAGNTGQGTSSISLGDYAGSTTQAPHAIAIGSNAGKTTQGGYSIAIGYGAGAGTSGPAQPARTIILNATAAELNGIIAQTDSTYIAPIRADASPTAVLYYNTTTKEVTQGALNVNLLTGTSLNSSIITSSLTSVGTLSALNVSGNAVIGGNLTVNGITTTLNSSTISIDDKNITLGSVTSVSGLSATLSTGTAAITLTAGTTKGLIPGQVLSAIGSGALGVSSVISSIDSETQLTMTVNHSSAGAVTLTSAGASSATANGGGLTVDNGGAGLTWTWASTTNAWTSNVNIDIAGAGTSYKVAGVDVATASTLLPTITTAITLGASVTSTITIGSSTGTLVSQNAKRNGLEIAPANYITVSATNGYALSTTITDNILVVSTTGYTATLTFPPSPVDGQITRFTVSTSTVTLALAAGPTLVGTFAGAVTANTTIAYKYRLSNTSWYRIQ